MIKRINELRKHGNKGFTVTELIMAAGLLGIVSTITASGVEELVNTVSTVLPATAKAELKCASDVLTSYNLTMQEAAAEVTDGSNPAVANALAICVAMDPSSEPDWLQKDLSKI